MITIHSRLSKTLLLVSAGVALACADLCGSELVKISGLQSVPLEQAEEWLASQITYLESSGVSMARADDIAYFLENALRDRGYDDALVEWKIVGDGDAKIIQLNVKEGSSQLISEFNIQGNIALSEEAVIELLTDATRNRLSLKPDTPVPFVQSDIKRGKRRLVEFYTLLGFSEVAATVEKRSTDSGIVVSVMIAEGPEHRVGSVQMPEAKSSELSEQFEEIRAEFTDVIFNPGLSGNLRSRVLSVVISAGYYEAVVTISDSARETVDEKVVLTLAVSIAWGEPFSVSKIHVTGNEKVTDRFFEQHFEGLVNQPYSPDRTNQRVEQLLQSGAFETVRTTPVKLADGTFQLDVSVEESYSRTLGIYGGFTNYDGPIGGFEFRNLNLWGTVRTVNAEVEFSKRGARGQVEYFDPWFLQSDYEFRTSLFAQSRDEEGYDKWDAGLSYNFTRRFGRQNSQSVSFFGKAAYTEVDDAEIAPVFLGDTDYFSHFVGASYTLDKRDRPQQARRGFIARASTSVASSATGSEIEFFRASGRVVYYHPVGAHTFRLAARAGTIQPIGDTQVIPIDLRFFNGGPQSVRSFQERGLGPIDPTSGYAIGGEFYTVFNAEYEIPIGAVPGLNFVVFGDAGNLLRNSGNFSLDSMRYAVGAGLRYLTPVGPLRFEYGYNPDQQPGEPQGTFHAIFGFAY